MKQFELPVFNHDVENFSEAIGVSHERFEKLVNEIKEGVLKLEKANSSEKSRVLETIIASAQTIPELVMCATLLDPIYEFLKKKAMMQALKGMFSKLMGSDSDIDKAIEDIIPREDKTT